MSITKIAHHDVLMLTDCTSIKTYAGFEFVCQSDAAELHFPDLQLFEGKTSSDGKTVTANKKRRIAKNGILPRNEYSWLYDIARNKGTIINQESFNVDIIGILEDALFMQYDSSPELDECGFFDWHKDTGDGYPNFRKLTMVVSLSDPEEYDGGELQLFDSGIINLGKIKKGCGVVFPSYVQHRVTKVTRGTRRTLVFFISGPRYR